ncbi:tRNA uridine-5-carboxymethylaminomethyl(34) synthesis GTPase MnmE [Verticiella sediminum]|uniref:tRNA modification GTPase MnmE n=1 Tax=Verticiella sediminum TaxID=1247510 RepID=A0A556AKG5_9BURK|nr:tRNA uridine-5-carboxymethylaminomethyl(34) synthesis GTPase MnmE [Verticiella sediminum]TSH93363.1 tRNA uridine-5-carboxymethylaminomethyl(34) synthesis GTPase MnmE [Verticiella sediminum]
MSATRSLPIVAIATAPGRGGIGVIRLSGAGLEPVMRAVLGRDDLTPRHAHYLPFRDADGSAIDEGLALYFPAPHSYTGEHVLELQGHGGPVVLRRLLARCLEAGRDIGLRLAEPGEFTQRAFLNERMDLAQAEAVADLIDAASEAAARGAAASLRGAFSREVNALADGIVHLRMLVEATLDFPEEEIDFLEKYQARDTLQGLRDTLAAILANARQGAILREGLHVVLAGQPNVGKSSLLNALAGFEAAIVTPVAGTTRDRVVQALSIDGVPLHIVDTAGLRDTEDLVEKIGIERTWQEIERADLILHLQDARGAVAAAPSESPDANRPNLSDAREALAADPAIDAAIAQRLPPGTPVLKVYNKVDLLSEDVQPPQDGLPISARQGAGLAELRAELLRIAGWNPGAESPYLARERHIAALNEADEHFALAAEHAAEDDRVLDLFAEELRLAHNALASITGQFTSDDLLGVIFSRFCIGK